MALQIKEILTLQALDTEIGRLRSEQNALDRGDTIERALAVRQAKLANAERRLHGLEIEQRNAELELKTLEEKKHGESRKLYEGRITAPRELQALEQEVAALERQRQRLDEQILRRLEEIAAAQKAVETVRATVEEASKAFRIVTRRYEKAKADIEGQLQAKEPQRAKLAGKLDKEVLRRYDSIRHRSHNVAAARIENGACGGCRMKVGGTLLRRVLAMDQYVYCESCSRFLFPQEEP